MTAQSVWRIGYEPDNRRIRVPFLTGTTEFSVLHRVQTGSMTEPAPYLMGIGHSSLELKQLRHEVDHSRPSSTEVKKVQNYNRALHISSLHGA